MRAPISILHVTTGMGEGGAEALLARLIAHSDGARVQHHLLSLSREGPLWEPTSRRCSRALNLLLDRPFAAVARIPRLTRFMRDVRPELIHGWMYHGNLAAGWLRNRYAPAAPLVLGIRQSLYDIRRERILTRMVIHSGASHSQVAAALIYNSAVSRQQHSALGYRDDVARVIPNGFDTAKFSLTAEARSCSRARLGLNDSEFAVGMVGRFHPVKDHLTFVRASARLAKELPMARFFIVGPGCTPKNSALREVVRRNCGSARIELLGAWRDTETFYPALDAFCLTSLSEGFPNVVGEAMSCGVVSVCTSVGDVPQLIGDVGFLVPVGDFRAIATHLLQIARFDAGQRVAASNAARQRIIANFAMNDMVWKYMNLYYQVIDGAHIADRLLN
jgi:glycosyltransferase involved in cell wall biosynthesis